jgi:hypothetical protein
VVGAWVVGAGVVGAGDVGFGAGVGFGVVGAGVGLDVFVGDAEVGCDVADDDGWPRPWPGCVGVPDDDVGDRELPPAPGGWPGEELPLAPGPAFPVSPTEVPPTCGPLLLPAPPAPPAPPGSRDDEEEPPGAGAELSRNPGCTKPSNSSTASNPTPATAARLVLIALPRPPGAPPSRGP